MSQVLFPLKPDRSDRETAGDPSQITSTGDWRVDHMTLQSRCVRACVRACERERERSTFYLFHVGLRSFSQVFIYLRIN